MSSSNILVENWVEFGFAISIIGLRMFSRSRVVGAIPSKRWCGDDWIAPLTLGVYTAMTMSIHISANKFSILALVYDPSLMNILTPELAHQARDDGHAEFLGWMTYIHLAWCLKTSLIFLYIRLTRNLNVRPLIIFISVTVGVTYLACLFGTLFHCFPIHKNWDIYPQPDACIISIPYTWVVCITNFVSDLTLFTVPVYLIYKVQYSLKKKILIGLSLCSGIVAIASIIARNVFVFKVLYHPESAENLVTQILEWSVREPFISVVVVNVPSIVPLFGCLGQDGSGKKESPVVVTNSRLRRIMNRRLGRIAQSLGLSTEGPSRAEIVDEEAGRPNMRHGSESEAGGDGNSEPGKGKDGGVFVSTDGSSQERISSGSDRN